MDGVLFDSERASLECWRILADEKNLPGIDEVYKRCIGGDVRHTRGILKNAYPSLSDVSVDELLSRSSILFHERYDHDGMPLPMKPYAKETLTALIERGHRLGLVSSTRKETVVRQLKNAHLYDMFEHITGGDEVSAAKPSPEIYQTGAGLMGVSPKDCIAIEDSYNGVRSAHAALCHTIMVPDMIPADDEMRRLAEVICNDLNEAYQWIITVS